MGKRGPNASSANAYARELGITRRALKRHGGAAKLRSLSPEVRAVLLGKHIYGSVAVRKGGLERRGYWPRTPGIVTQPVQERPRG